jgi:hypothetical protein
VEGLFDGLNEGLNDGLNEVCLIKDLDGEAGSEPLVGSAMRRLPTGGATLDAVRQRRRGDRTGS